MIGDSVRLRQIVTNLASNAIKFTETGHILISITEEWRQDERTMLHVRVTDTGMGIPADKQAKVFEAFSQADGSTTRKFGGTGLGLTISSTLVQLMGGRIWLESEMGVGSTFHFTVNLGVGEPPPEAADDPQLTDLRVLIVDDNSVNRTILERRVATWKMRYTSVDGGQKAMEELTAAADSGRPFKLMLLDVNMPGVDGFAVAKYVSLHPALADMGIVMLSSSGLGGRTALSGDAGVSVYLTKPVRPNELLAAISRALDPGAKRALSLPRVGACVDASNGPRRRKVLVAEDNVVNQRVAVSLLTTRGHDVVIVDNGLKAVEAVARETFDVVLMDVQMPQMDGFEATAAIRAREKTTGGHTWIVAMTAHALSGDADRCRSSGMDGYLSKPLDLRKLYAAVEDAPAGEVPKELTPPATF